VKARAEGYFATEGIRKRNKFNRNFGWLLHGLLSKADCYDPVLNYNYIKLVDKNGSVRNTGGIIQKGTPLANHHWKTDEELTWSESTNLGSPFGLAYGTGTASERFDDNWLSAPAFEVPDNIKLIEFDETNNKSIIQIGSRFVADTAYTINEVGLFLDIYGAGTFLLNRAVLGSSISIAEDEMRTDAYQWEFLSGFTKYFASALFASICGDHASRSLITAIDSAGAKFKIRSPYTFKCESTLKIGTDTTSPSLDDYNLINPTHELLDQYQYVREDSDFNRTQILRIGVWTPATDEQVGEIGFFTKVYDEEGGEHEILIARGTFDTPISLQANKTYVFGFVLEF